MPLHRKVPAGALLGETALGVAMSDTRRKFLTLLAGLAGTGTLAAAGTLSLAPQSRVPPGHPPFPDASHDEDEPATFPGKSRTQQMLEANQKDIKQNIEKLYKLAADLKAEVEKTDSSKVLSLTLVKKAEEIEKLAHDIKNRAKG